MNDKLNNLEKLINQSGWIVTNETTEGGAKICRPAEKKQR